MIQIYSYIWIFSNTNIRSYYIRIIFLIRIYSDIHSYHFFDTNILGGYLLIRIFVRIIFLIQLYSDIRSYRFLDINIFKYSFVSKIYIRHTLHYTYAFYHHQQGRVDFNNVRTLPKLGILDLFEWIILDFYRPGLGCSSWALGAVFSINRFLHSRSRTRFPRLKNFQTIIKDPAFAIESLRAEREQNWTKTLFKI